MLLPRPIAPVRFAVLIALLFGAAQGVLAAEDATLNAFQKAVESAPKDDSAHYNLGVAYFNRRRYADAAA